MNELKSIVLLIIMSLLMVTCSQKESTEENNTNPELPAGGSIVLQNYNGWDEIKTSEDGSTFFNKYNSLSDKIESTLFMLRGKSDDVYCGFVKFDENEMPKYIYFNDIMISIDSCYNDLFNASVIVGDTLIYSLDSLSLPNGITRSREQNNWARNTCDVGVIVTSAVGIGNGALTIAGGVAGSAPSAGASLGLIFSGTLQIKSSLKDMNNALNDLFVEKYSDNGTTIPLNIYTSSTNAEEFNELQKMMGEKLGDVYLSKVFPEEIVKNMGVASTSASIASWGFKYIDAHFGETITTEESIRRRAAECLIITSKATKITETTARLNGYVSGESVQGYQTRYGFIVSSEEGKVYTNPIDNGIGESFFVDCTELSEGTDYQYCAYVWDYTHRYIKFGIPRSFRTNSRNVPVSINNVRVKKSSWDEENYIYKGHSYSYKFDCAVTVELIDDENIREWGYVYEDPNGERVRINLSSSNGYYTDERYVYYRDEPISTLKLCGYVKYKQESDYRYGELKEFALEYEEQPMCPDINHPHKIYLGTPQGVSFSCCNLGASFPEDYGGLYTFGDPTGTLKMDNETYDNYYNKVISYPEDISGTQYDIATVQWGTEWRTPNLREGRALYNNCKWVWTRYNGTPGFKIIGPNGNHIFIPAAGIEWEDCEGIYHLDTECNLWLSQRSLENKTYVWWLITISGPTCVDPWVNMLGGLPMVWPRLSIRPVSNN